MQGKVVGGAALLLSDVFMSAWLLIFNRSVTIPFQNVCAGQKKSKNSEIKKLHFLPKESGRQYGSTARYGTVPKRCFFYKEKCQISFSEYLVFFELKLPSSGVCCKVFN